MDGIIINAPGFQTSIQDRGRFGLQWSGMCPAGAMDMHSLSIANILVGNSRGEAGLEVTMIGPDMTFTADTSLPSQAPIFRRRSTALRFLCTRPPACVRDSG